MSLFVLDQLGREFAVLGHKIRQRLTLSELDELYDRAESGHTFEGAPVWHLTRKKKKGQQKLRKAELGDLPDELYLRDTLLAEQLSTESEPPMLASELGDREAI